MFLVVDKFRVHFALESLFSAFLKFSLENTEYAKLMEIFSLNPTLVCIHISFGFKVLIKVDVIDRQQPQVFSRAIRSTSLPNPIGPPTSIAKYNDETMLELCLADFRLACQLGGARGDDRAIIR